MADTIGHSAFLSYVRFVDKHEKGWISEFGKRLSGEFELQTGEKLEIFQDRKDIAWGQNWRQRIDDSLNKVTFLIPILTPSFFKSDECRSELERFLKREEDLDKGGLVLPVYYVRCLVLEDPERRAADPLAQALAKRQFADWRKLRFEESDSGFSTKSFEELALQIDAALSRPAGDARPGRHWRPQGARASAANWRNVTVAHATESGSSSVASQRLGDNIHEMPQGKEEILERILEMLSELRGQLLSVSEHKEPPARRVNAERTGENIRKMLQRTDEKQGRAREIQSELEEASLSLAARKESDWVLVLMSFDDDMKPIYQGIAAATERAGFTPRPVRNVAAETGITDTIEETIASSRFIVVDLTYERPSIHFELGYARGLGKEIIPIARKGVCIRFDLKGLTCIEYVDSRTLEEDLHKRLAPEANEGT